MSFTYEFPRAAVTVDCVVLGCIEGELSVLLIQRKSDPFRGNWALPGGFFDLSDATVEEAAARELQEETGISGVKLEQLYTFSREGRDPRGRTLSIAHFGLVTPAPLDPVAGDDAQDAAWYPLSSLPPLAFDHGEIIERAVQAYERETLLEQVRTRREIDSGRTSFSG